MSIIRHPRESDRPYDQSVGAVNDGGLERGEIDLGGRFRVMAHSFANYTDGNSFGARRRCPAVAGAVESQGNLEIGQARDCLELPVYARCAVTVGDSFVGKRVGEYRQQILSGIRWIFLDYRLHFFGPRYVEALSRFPPTVGHMIVCTVLFSQESHIDEAHPPQIETQHEHVAGEVHLAPPGQLQILYAAYGGDGDRPFDGAFSAGIDVAKRIALFDGFAFHGPVIDGAEYAHVERGGVRYRSADPQIGLVGLDEVRRDFIEHEVAAAAEP